MGDSDRERGRGGRDVMGRRFKKQADSCSLDLHEPAPYSVRKSERSRQTVSLHQTPALQALADRPQGMGVSLLPGVGVVADCHWVR
jgi:hypothetical protein